MIPHFDTCIVGAHYQGQFSLVYGRHAGDNQVILHIGVGRVIVEPFPIREANHADLVRDDNWMTSSDHFQHLEQSYRLMREGTLQQEYWAVVGQLLNAFCQCQQCWRVTVQSVVSQIASEHRNCDVVDNCLFDCMAEATIRFIQIARRVVQVRGVQNFHVILPLMP